MDIFMALWNTDLLTKRMILGNCSKINTNEVNDHMLMPIWNVTVPHSHHT